MKKPIITIQGLIASFGAIAVICFISVCGYVVQDYRNDIKFNAIKVETMNTERDSLKIHVEDLKINYEKMKIDKNSTEADLRKAEEVLKQQEDELKKKDAALQAKAEAKRIEGERLAAAAHLQAFSATAAAASPGGSNESFTYNFLTSHGFTKAQTAGIMGNLRQEHNYNTSDVPGGLGIAQWMGGRRANLLARENSHQIGTQLQFLVDELNGPESAAGAAIKSAGSVESATIAFQNKFERCGTCHQSQRIQYAYDIFNRY